MNDIWSFGSSIFIDGFLYFVIKTAIDWAIAILLVKAIKHSADRIEKKRQANGLQSKYVYLTLRTIIYAVALFATLDSIKPLSGVGKAALGATSVFAVAVSLAAQESFSNYISGFFLAIYQPFQVGDFITLKEKGVSGTVYEITFRHTVLHTVDNTNLIIPNSVMNTAIIEDKANDDINYVKWMDVSVAYDTDFAKAKQIITEAVSRHPKFIDERSEEDKASNVPPVIIRLNEFQDSGIQLQWKVTCKQFGDSFQMASDIREEILKRFNEEGVNIPFPTVHLS